MRRYLVWMPVLLLVGCGHLPNRHPHRQHRTAEPCPSADACGPEVEVVHGAEPSAGCGDGAGCRPAAKSAAGKPECEREVHVEAPAPKAHAARRAVARTQTEQQQFVQTRQMILVPQQVLVPFIQTTARGPVRVGGLQETQLVNVTGTTGVAGTAGALLTAEAAGAARADGPAPASTPAPARAAADDPARALAICTEELRQARERYIKLEASMKRLEADLGQLKPPAADPPPATPPANVPQLPLPPVPPPPGPTPAPVVAPPPVPKGP